MRCGLCSFFNYKTANRTTPCSAIRCTITCGAVMPFCGRFLYNFCGLCGLYNLVNTPTNLHIHTASNFTTR